jgi:hypothetical protein
MQYEKKRKGRKGTQKEEMHCKFEATGVSKSSNEIRIFVLGI